MKTMTINDEYELDKFLEPYKTGEDSYYCPVSCDYNCDCEPDQILKDGVMLNGEPYNSFSWWNSQFIEFPCEVSVLEN